MTDSQSFMDPWLDLMRAWMPPGIQAPNQLTQSILQGWSLVSITETNSKSPSTERAVVAKASYGRQLGRIMDAVERLIKDRPDAKTEDAFIAFEALRTLIETAKQDAAEARIAALIADLDSVKAHDPDAFKRQTDALRTYLATA